MIFFLCQFFRRLGVENSKNMDCDKNNMIIDFTEELCHEFWTVIKKCFLFFIPIHDFCECFLLKWEWSRSFLFFYFSIVFLVTFLLMFLFLVYLLTPTTRRKKITTKIVKNLIPIRTSLIRAINIFSTWHLINKIESIQTKTILSG